jgi:GDP/UDP-N,N'-diacetylbacillosamine 2-epimerase (hydrolysing)
VIGNSSSGLLEAPSFKVGTINIGSRQRGRLQSASVINCEVTKSSIKGALSKLFSLEFQRDLENAKNPYGDGGSSEAIVAHIEQQPLENLLVKHFHDLH